MNSQLFLGVNYITDGPSICNIPQVLSQYSEELKTLILCFSEKQFYQASIYDYNFYILQEEVIAIKQINKLSIVYFSIKPVLDIASIKQMLEHKLLDVKKQLEQLENPRALNKLNLKIGKLIEQQGQVILESDISGLTYLQKYLSQIYFSLLNGFSIGIYTQQQINLQQEFQIIQGYTKYVLNGQTTIVPRITGIVTTANVLYLPQCRYSTIKPFIIDKVHDNMFCGQLCQFFNEGFVENFDIIISLNKPINVKNYSTNIKKVNNETYCQAKYYASVKELVKIGHLQDWPNGQELYINLQETDMSTITNEILKLTYSTWFEDSKLIEQGDQANISISSNTPQRRLSHHNSRTPSVDRNSQVEGIESSQTPTQYHSRLARRVLSIDELDND